MKKKKEISLCRFVDLFIQESAVLHQFSVTGETERL